MLPDGRIGGLSDAMALIHAYYIGRDTSDLQATYMSISPRELEVLTARLYTELGYITELTPARRDGGRDILARRTDAGRQHLTFVECKHYSSPVGVHYVRALLGAVAHERANTGVLVSTSTFTRGAKNMADEEPAKYNSVDEFNARLLNEHSHLIGQAGWTGSCEIR